MTVLPTVLVIAAAVGSAVVGGVFFGFSALVLPGLARIESRSAVAAMQAINVVAVRPPLMLALFGTALVSAAVLVLAFLPWQTGSAWLIAGAVIYLAGVVGVTGAVNVPLNNALAARDTAHPETAALWATYLRRWTRANTVRGWAGALAALAFLLALIV